MDASNENRKAQKSYILLSVRKPLTKCFSYKLQNTNALTYFENMEYSKLKHEYKRLIQAYHMRDTMHKHKIEYVNK